jgi:peptidoglycan/LPS O-acetylase OafA/YrhL
MKPSKLLSITALRFFAASTICYYHTWTYFGWTADLDRLGFCPDQAVSFFFVLSGFILTHAYPELDGLKDRIRFVVARLARIWPLHFVTALLLILHTSDLRPHDLASLGASLANIFLIHAWIPLDKFYFSMNAVSWSISTEMFFYLCFPFLIQKWRKTWAYKLLGSLIILLSIIIIVNVMDLPMRAPGVHGTTTFDWIYINPLSRLFEFVLGMSTYLLWQNWNKARAPRKWISTAFEIGAIGIVLLNLFMIHLLMSWASHSGKAVPEWLAHNGSCFSFSLLILVIGMERGFVSDILKTKIFVFLGELSFAIYMLNQMTLTQLYPHLERYFTPVTPWTVAFFWMLILGLSLISWKLIEVPARIHLLRVFKKVVDAKSETKHSSQQDCEKSPVVTYPDL